MRPFLDLEYFFYKAYTFFADGFGFLFGGFGLSERTLFWLTVISFILSAIFLAGICYNVFYLVRSRKKQIKEFVKTVMEAPPEERVSRWAKIKKHLESESPSDWRQAILEADALMDEIIKKIGYKGETFGERLSHIHPAQFKSLDEVWRAHKIRNRIAHEGTKFDLTKEEAEQVLGLYEKALTELEFI